MGAPQTNLPRSPCHLDGTDVYGTCSSSRDARRTSPALRVPPRTRRREGRRVTRRLPSIRGLGGGAVLPRLSPVTRPSNATSQLWLTSLVQVVRGHCLHLLVTRWSPTMPPTLHSDRGSPVDTPLVSFGLRPVRVPQTSSTSHGAVVVTRRPVFLFGCH